MKYEIYVERKVSTMPYENMTVGYSQSFDDDVTPPDGAFKVVAGKVEEWVTAESRRVGVKNFEIRDPMLDMSNEPRASRRYR